MITATESAARQPYRLVEPIHLVTYFSGEPTDALMALGLRNYWDGYFAGPHRCAGSRPRWSTRSSTTLPTARSAATSPRVG
jgi:hypothetical protein